MRIAAVLFLLTSALVAPASHRLAAQMAVPVPAAPAERALWAAQQYVRARMQDDVAELRARRPSCPFWRHIFTVPDGSIVFGSAADGRLLATFPVRGDWARDGAWEDPALRRTLAGRRLPR